MGPGQLVQNKGAERASILCVVLTIDGYLGNRPAITRTGL